ncbi:maternal protein exuperantia-2-like [Menidia menidia]
MLNVESGGAERAEPPQVFFDLETTGLDQNCEIVQLAAVSGDHSLNLYVVPRCRIQRGAAQVTGFRVRRQRLYQHHRPVLTNSLREVLVSFIAFLQMLGRPLLVGHNIRRFDCPVIVRVLEEFDLREKFELSVSGCVDTLPLAREMLKHRGLKSFGQEALVSELLGLNYKAHDALGDVRALQTLYRFLRPTPELVRKHTFTLDRTDSEAPEAAARTGEAREAAEQRPLWEHFTQAVSLTGEQGPL